MDNRYFRAALTSGLGMIAFGVTVLVIDATKDRIELIVSIIFFSILVSFGIWGIVNLIKGERDNG